MEEKKVTEENQPTEENKPAEETEAAHTLQERLRELREDCGLYQKEVAEALGCTQQTYSRYETGELEPSVKGLRILADLFGTSSDYLICLTNTKKPYRRIDPNKKKKAEKK